MAEVPRVRREIIEGMVDASNRGDMEGVLQRTHPEIEIDDPERTGTSRGHQAVRDFSEFSLPLHYVLRFRDGMVSRFGVRTEAAAARSEVGLD
jgi:hypothetical protein